MSGRTVKLSSRKQAAIIALLTQPTVAEAARVAGVRPNTLGRWMKEPAFDAEWRAARSLGLDQAIARLQKISGAAVSARLKVMFDPGSPPAAQLKAAETVLRYAKAAAELEYVEVRLTELEHTAARSKPEALGSPGDKRRRPQSKGHGEKFSRMKEAAIAALLTHRSVEEAARAIDIGASTLYQWRKYPEFVKGWREAKRAAFLHTNVRLHQAAGAATAIIARVLAHPATPWSTRIRAASLSFKYGLLAIEEDIGARLLALGFGAEVTQAVLHGDRRLLDDDVGSHPKAA
jgi:transposase-like protein